MRTNYNTMPAEQLREEGKRLHRKLVLPNLVIVLLSLVAALSLLFFPLLRVSVRLDEQTAEIAAELIAEAGEGEGAEEMAEQYAFLLRDADVEIAVTLRPTELFGAGFSEGTEGLHALINGAAGDLTAVADELSAQMLPAVLGLTAMGAAGAETGGEDFSEVNTDGFVPVIEKLNAQDFAGARVDFETALPAFLAQLDVTLTDEQLQSAMESYDAMVDEMTVDGRFSAANLLSAMTGGSGEGSDGDAEDGVGDFLAMLSDPGAFVDELDAETADTIRTVCMGISVGIIAVAGLWLLLALLALLHVFLPNKKVGMWYVKATGWIPFLLFFAAPAIALAVLPQTGAVTAQVAAILPALSVGGMTFISALCLLALWIVSIFWCHPVKKRIRRCRLALRAKRA